MPRPAGLLSDVRARAAIRGTGKNICRRNGVSEGRPSPRVREAAGRKVNPDKAVVRNGRLSEGAHLIGHHGG